MPVNIAAIIYAVLLVLAPPSKAKHLPGWEETEEQAMARYALISTDIAAVSGSLQDVATLVGIAYHESRFAPDVDLGPCYRGPGLRARCPDHAVSIWQIVPLTRAEARLYQKDRRSAAGRALSLAKRSWGACRKNERKHRLAAYASGRCDRGLKGSAELVRDVDRAFGLIALKMKERS